MHNTIKVFIYKGFIIRPFAMVQYWCKHPLKPTIFVINQVVVFSDYLWSSAPNLHQFIPNPRKMAGAEGFEPSTYGFGVL